MIVQVDSFKFFIYAGELNLLYFLMILMALDIGTGIGKAFYNGNLWSRKSLFGFSRKIFIFFVIILANVFDQLLNLNGTLLYATMIFYIANEGLSIIENLALMDVKVPGDLQERLRVFNETKKDIKHDIKYGIQDEEIDKEKFTDVDDEKREY